MMIMMIITIKGVAICSDDVDDVTYMLGKLRFAYSSKSITVHSNGDDDCNDNDDGDDTLV